ncbi:MAG: methylated-DNA--[protein]-cysteine S-methyltransferase [Chloroflexi bacterium]|nr:methylated-DNA--[protein]-cysteine S-methyltransferase [Chloroflexota bacterium]
MAEDRFLVETRLGWLGVVWGERGLARLCLPQPTREAAQRQVGAATDGIPAGLGNLAQRLQRYFEGEPVAFPEPVDLSAGTPFQQEVWRALREIPLGATLTYGELARRVGRPRAARAVGQAVGANPVPIVIPCHRVIAAGGGLCGYTGADLSFKAALLRLEAEAARRPR